MKRPHLRWGTTSGLTASTTTLDRVVPTAGGATVVHDSSASSGTNMTIEFRTDGSGGLLTPVRILNMGTNFNYGDIITIPDGILVASGGGNDT